MSGDDERQARRAERQVLRATRAEDRAGARAERVAVRDDRAGERATRRRGAGLEADILAATWEELAAVGYARLTMEGVAARACTGKQVIYRRWPNRAQLVVAALRSRVGPLLPEIPDTGDLREDVLEVLRPLVRRALTAPPDLIFGLLSEAPDLGPAFFASMQEIMTQLLRQAERRGEVDLARIPARVVQLPADLMRWELIRSQDRFDAEQVMAEIVDQVWLPLVRSGGGEGEAGGSALGARG